MADTVETELITEFPAPRSCPLHPPAPYARLQRERPVARVRLPSGREAVLITRHEDARALLDDERLSADENKPGYPFLYAGGFQSPLAGTFMRADGAEHYRVRRMLAGEFTVRRAAELRPEVESIVDECLAAMRAQGPPVDLVEALAFPVPARTICRLLGVPPTDRPEFEAITRAMINTGSSAEEVGAATRGLYGYLDGLVTRKLAAPADDLLGRLIERELKPGRLGRGELVMIAMILLVGGHETTATMLALGALALLEHGTELARLRAEPDLWPGAVDELLRHQTIVQAPIQRAVLADIEVNGEVIRAGEGVLVTLPTVNRDPAAFDAPDRLDWRRDARDHLAFSFGPHRCLGHTLARLELAVAWRALFERFPTLALAAPVERVPLRAPTVGLFGPESLPVTW